METVKDLTEKLLLAAQTRRLSLKKKSEEIKFANDVILLAQAILLANSEPQYKKGQKVFRKETLCDPWGKTQVIATEQTIQAVNKRFSYILSGDPNESVPESQLFPTREAALKSSSDIKNKSKKEKR